MAESRTVGLNGDNVSEDVAAVQTILASWMVAQGVPPIAVTGSLDAPTAAGIAVFEASMGLLPTGLVHVPIDDDAAPLAQGQGEGDTISEACNAARNACKALAGCPADAPLKMGKCSCWRGGSRTWTCVVQCGCSMPIA
jgi:hypothetical protein